MRRVVIGDQARLGLRDRVLDPALDERLEDLRPASRGDDDPEVAARPRQWSTLHDWRTRCSSASASLARPCSIMTRASHVLDGGVCLLRLRGLERGKCSGPARATPHRGTPGRARCANRAGPGGRRRWLPGARDERARVGDDGALTPRHAPQGHDRCCCEDHPTRAANAHRVSLRPSTRQGSVAKVPRSRSSPQRVTAPSRTFAAVSSVYNVGCRP